jgi:hypothetical protein
MECLQQLSSHRAHLTQVTTNNGTPVPPQPPGTSSESNTFVGRDGKEDAYLIPPALFRMMTPDQRTTELLCLNSNCNRGVASCTASQAVQTPPTSSTPPVATISYATVAGATPSVISALPAPSIAPAATPSVTAPPGGSLL